jgi:2-desacetyl-2-hydroxyethyl bacteriochlorophyllide A dehydrogenase
MKAVYIKSPYQFDIREVTLRDIGPDEALVDIKACGICGTDVHSAVSDAPDWMPFGHEISGVIEQVGIAVKGFKPGDPVLVESGSFCGRCDACKNGRTDLCVSAPNIFANESMGFAEKIIVPANALVHLGKIGFAEATLVEPLGVAMDVTTTADIQLNDDVLVIGIGPIGLFAIRLARMLGARKVYAAGRSTSQKRIELARLFGADDVILTDQVDLADYPFARGGPDKVIVTAPPKMIMEALKIVNYGGTVAFIGIEMGEAGQISFDANDFHFRKLQLRASHAVPALWFPRILEMIDAGKIDVKALISGTFKLEEIATAFDTLRNDKANSLKMVMVRD